MKPELEWGVIEVDFDVFISLMMLCDPIDCIEMRSG